MKYLGIDYGSKRIGIALSNAEGTIAFPRMTLANNASILSALVALVDQERIQTIVFGDTRTLSGIANPVTADMEAFAERLQEKSGLPVHFEREAGSSVAASEHTSGHDDAAAAAFILQRFLDKRARSVE